MIYNYSSNICCARHLYFVEKNKKGYLATCLYCNHKEEACDHEHLYRQLYGASFIHQTKIPIYHGFEYTLSETKSFIEQLILNNPTLTNEEVINEFEIFLYNIDLSNLLITKKKHNSLLSNTYYDQKILILKRKIEELEDKRSKYQKVKVKTK